MSDAVNPLISMITGAVGTKPPTQAAKPPAAPTPTSPTQIPNKNLPSVSDTKGLANAFRERMGVPPSVSKFETAANNRNPFALKSFEEQGASVEGKVRRLINDPKYQKLSPVEKVRVRDRLYNQYVVPIYKNAGKQVPDRKQWLYGTKHENIYMQEPQSFGAARDPATSVAMGAQPVFDNINLFGAKFSKDVLATMYGLGAYFTHPIEVDKSKILDEAYKKADNKYLNSWIKSATQAVRDDKYLLDTRPREGFYSKAAEWTGEQVASLPLYVALDAVKVGEAIGGAAKQIGLTDKLLSTPTGQFVARRISNAFAGMTGTMISEGRDEPTRMDVAAGGVGGAVLGGAFEKGGELVGRGAGALFNRAAKWFSDMGKPLPLEGEYMPFREAPKPDEPAGPPVAPTTRVPGKAGLPEPAAPLEGEYLSHEEVTPSTQAPKPEGPPTIPATSRPDAPTKSGLPMRVANDMAIKKWSGENIALGGEPHMENIIHSAFHILTKELPASTTPIIKLSNLDPAVRDLHMGEMMALQSLSLRHYGMPIDELPPNLQKAMLSRRLELVREATHELPIHVPELHKQDVQKDLEAQANQSQFIKQGMEELKRDFGVDVSQVVTNNDIEHIKNQTGVKDPARATSRLGKKPPVAKRITPEKFASYRIDTRAYFKNPYGEGRRAADGTLIGGRDKRPWNVRMKAENRKQFIETLKEADGNMIRFENPYHRMLYHWSNRDHLPDSVRSKLLREMKDLSKELYKGISSDWGARDFDSQADRALLHLQMMAQSGRLSAEKNIFRSSEFFGAPTDWMLDLNTEIDDAEIQHLKEVIEMHPHALKAMQPVLELFQQNRARFIKDPEQWMEFNRAINMFVTGMIG